MTTTIKLRRDTSTNWTSSNPILAAGEPGLETDTLRVKYGDGSNTWTNLAYSAVGNATYATTAGSATSATTAVSAATATSATSALTAGTVTTAAQPNITSVGTLTSVVSTGDISGANLVITGSSELGNSVTANYFVGTLHGAANTAQVAGTVTNNAQPNITSVGILSSVVAAGNITTTGYFVGDGGFLTNVAGGGSSYSNANVANYLPTYSGNILSLHVTSNTESVSPTTGALRVEGGIGANGDIHTGGVLHASGNIDCNGDTVFIGPFASATGITGPVIVGFSAGEDYIQAVLKNSRGNGSADWTSTANEGDEAQGWTSMGMSGSTFNDPNYTITKPGDGYVLAAGLLGSGGNLVFATGATGTKKDIVFATGGFGAGDEFARIDHANAALHLTKSGSKIKFRDATEQNTAWTGSVTASNVSGLSTVATSGSYNDLSNTPTLGNIAVVNLDGNVSNVLFGNGIFSAIPTMTGDVKFTADEIYTETGRLTIFTSGAVLPEIDRVDIETAQFTVDTTQNINLYSGQNVTIVSNNASGGAKSWLYNTDGNIVFPDTTVQSTAWTGNVAAANVTGLGDIATITLDGNVSNVLTGLGSFVALPTIDANTVVWTTAPVANNSTGTPGQIAYDTGGNLYVCVATDTWAKFTGSTSW